MSKKDFQNGFAMGFTSGRKTEPFVLCDIPYADMAYNNDNTMTLVDKNGVEHTIVCEYTDGKLTSVKYDGKPINLTYDDDDVLTKVGNTDINLGDSFPTTPDSGGSGSDVTIDENGIVHFGGSIDSQGIVTF